MYPHIDRFDDKKQFLIDTFNQGKYKDVGDMMKQKANDYSRYNKRRRPLKFDLFSYA